MSLTPVEFIAALKAGRIEYVRTIGVSIAAQFVGRYQPMLAGKPVIVRAA